MPLSRLLSFLLFYSLFFFLSCVLCGTIFEFSLPIVIPYEQIIFSVFAYLCTAGDYLFQPFSALVSQIDRPFEVGVRLWFLSPLNSSMILIILIFIGIISMDRCISFQFSSVEQMWNLSLWSLVWLEANFSKFGTIRILRRWFFLFPFRFIGLSYLTIDSERCMNICILRSTWLSFRNGFVVHMTFHFPYVKGKDKSRFRSLWNADDELPPNYWDIQI